MEQQHPLLVILGPTASGKTRLAVRLAAALKGELISADSRQVFKDMDIGTGKDLKEYQINGKQIPYHLINIREAGARYNVNEFKEDFYQELDDNFNTPQAFAALFDFIKKINQLLDQNLISKKQAVKMYNFFQEIDKIFGIVDFKKVNLVIPAEIKKLAKEREQARKNQDWKRSDEIRLEIEKRGFVVEDTQKGPVIKR